MEITANLTFDKILHTKNTDAHLVISLTAPAAGDSAKRPPLCLIPLIDVSPSMNGDKISYAKRSLIKMIEHLSAKDYCGLVRFSSDARTVAEPQLCTNEFKEELKRKVNELTTGGGTNISSAMLEGLKIANNMDLSAEVITRVILFTDGMCNTGPAITPADMLELVKPNIGIASISAFGYGKDAQQEFLLDLSKAGNGNYSFVQNPDDALTAFGQELGGLLSTCATNFTVEVEPLSGHSITKVVTDVDAEEEAVGLVSITFPDMVSEETRHLVLAIQLQAQKNAFPRDVNVFNIKVNYDVLDEHLRLEHKSVELKAKCQFVKEGEQSTKVAPELDKIVGLAQMVRAQLEAEEQAKRGDYSAAAATMDFMASDFSSRGLEGLGSVATNLGKGLTSRESYSASAGYRSSLARGATRSVGGSYSAFAANELRSLGVSLSTSAQANVIGSFQSDDGTATSAPSTTVTTVGTVTPVGTIGNPSWMDNPLTGGFNPHTLTTILGPGVDNKPAEAPEPKEVKKARKPRISQKTKRW